MNTYLLLKHLHVSAVVISGGGFVARFLLMLRHSPWLKRPLCRVIPHCVDTLLLGSAMGMAIISRQYPFVEPWLTAKFFGLLAYIVLGTLALKRGRTRQQKILWLFAALTALTYVVSVAIRRDPMGFMAYFISG